MKRIALLGLLVAACCAPPKCDSGICECPEDVATEDLRVGRYRRNWDCPVVVQRALGGCLYRDICGQEIWLTGCVAEGEICGEPDFSGVFVTKGE